MNGLCSDQPQAYQLPFITHYNYKKNHMGLSHHWRRPTELTAGTFRAAAHDVCKLLASSPVELAGFDGTGSPIIGDDRIVINGRTPLACEPFEIALVEFDRRGNSEVRSFCKTEGLPYDLIVKAALIVFQHHLKPHFVVTSDQMNDDWASARDLVQSTLGFGESFCLSQE